MTSGNDVGIALHRRNGALQWRMTFASLPLDDTPGSPWLLTTREVREAFDLTRRAGTPLDRVGLGPPLLGVKCGCNEAFVVTHEAARDARIEPSVLRPVVRGETIRAWRVLSTTEWIIWTHGDSDDGVNMPRASLPTHTAAWLSRWRSRLEARSDVHGRSIWWSLFRTPSASSSATRVVWSDLGRRPRAAVLAAGDRSVPLNTCYVIRVNDEADGFALAALLNSEIAAAWLNLIAEPAASGYHRYLGWTVGLLPVPSDWPRARGILAPIGRAAATAPPADSALNAAVADAYGLPIERLEPLLAWTTW